MKASIIAALLAWMLLAPCRESAAIVNPITNPSFEDGLGSPWYAYQYVPAPPLSSGLAAYPTTGTPGGTFNLIPPYTLCDGSYVCGMESNSSQSKNGGVCQTFLWDDGAGDLSVKVRVAFDLPSSNGAYVRLGVAPGQTTDRSLVSQWTQCSNSSDWTTLTLSVSGTPNTHTVFIEAYQPGGTGSAMSTLWDDVRWVPYLTFQVDPVVAGSDPAHPDTTARITWTTNLASTSQVDYQSGTGSWQVVTDPTLVTSHSVLITNLQPGSTCVFRATSTAPGCREVVSQDYTFQTPIQISNIASSGGDPDVTVTWTTDVASTSWVDYGLDTGYGQTAGSDSLVTNHSVALTGLVDGKTYHYRVRSGGGAYTTISSTDKTFKTMAAPQPALTNPSFERLEGGVPDLYPWTKYPNAQNNYGVIGPYPSGGPDFWTIEEFPFSVSMQAYDGSYFLGYGTKYTYHNGGVYQRILTGSAQTYAFCARFAAYQSESVGYLYTLVDVGIDPTGGTNPNAPTVKWLRVHSPTNDNQWFPFGLVADAPAGTVTVFLGTTQFIGLTARAVAIDDAIFGTPMTMNIGDLRSRARCPGVMLENKIVTCVEPSTTHYHWGTYEYETYQKIYVQEPLVPSGIGVLLGPIDPMNPPEMPQVGNKVTVTGALAPLGMETVIMSPKWTIDHGAYDLPRPLACKQKDVGGSAHNQVPLYAPSLCNLGVRLRLFGKVTWPDSAMDGDVYLDDGSDLPKTFDDESVRPRVKGIRMRLTAKGDDTTFYSGDYMAATGVLTIDNIASLGWPEYEYVLEVNDPNDWQILHSGP